MSTAGVQPVGTNVSNHGFDALDPDSYTAHRLKHASPKHLHLTTRRFFIGPIPEGWLNSNRKAWYRRRLELSTYSSRSATFTAAANMDPHQRTLKGIEGLSTAARMSFSFPQPEDVEEEASGGEETEAEDDDDDPEVDTRNIAPVATDEIPQILGIADEEDPQTPKAVPIPSETGLGTPERGRLVPSSTRRLAKSPGQETFVTARETIVPSERTASVRNSQEDPSGRRSYMDGADNFDASTGRPTSASGPEDSYLDTSPSAGSYPGDTGSSTALLPPESPTSNRKAAKSARSIQEHEPAPLTSDETGAKLRKTTTGVRFRVNEGVANRHERIVKRINSTKDRMAGKHFRRSTLQEGTIVKMEKMLVRVDVTMQQLADDYDENESIKTETRVVEKWREFMVVARRSSNEAADDFRLQIYKTRVIPEIDNEKATKKPTREVRLDPSTTHVNLYSSLDKTLVVWHPYRKGTRIMIMKSRSAAGSVEWYTFLRDALGWKRPTSVQVNVPDLDVTLLLERPFEGVEIAAVAETDEQTAITKTIAAEQAVASKIITQCVEMLESDPEWSSVLQTWSKTVKMGLAWKRYDRLEWVHGANEQKMYGSMAMQNSHDLELRPKQHYPTTTYGRKGVAHEEPAPIEGFLIRLTSQKGIHKRFGKTFFKRLYFATQNQFLTFNRPAKTTPPHPPRLATIGGTNVPSSQEIVEKSPTMFDIDPFPLSDDDEITWLTSGSEDYVRRHDLEALEEARRTLSNLTESDGYINMCRIVKVRKMDWGASSVDEEMDSGSDVDFHQEVQDTQREDGATKVIDDDRVFELVLDNDLVVRLQAYNSATRDEWMKRLRKLVKYWKLRTRADMDLFKSVRRSNLNTLNIDEEMEAMIGQFARKWEVSRSEASPHLYHMCGISVCRPITLSGLLYRKPSRRAAFQRCGVILAGGQLIIYQAAVRKSTGEQIKHIHQEKQQVLELKDCYVYSGLITGDDLLYQNQTFDANHPGMHALPRVYLDDGWTSTDENAMTCFVVWYGVRRSWFRSGDNAIQNVTDDSNASVKRRGGVSRSSGTGSGGGIGGARSKIRRVGQLGVPGKGVVFKCRSRAERDHWVLGVACEIERVVEAREGEVRFES